MTRAPDSIDAFHGREKDAVLVSPVRANADGDVGFLSDLRRTNVALTRADRHLFVVCDSATLARHPCYARLVEAAQGLDEIDRPGSGWRPEVRYAGGRASLD